MAPAASFASLPSCLSFFILTIGEVIISCIFFSFPLLSLFLSSLFFLLLSRGSLHLSGSRKGEIEGTIRELLPDSSFFFFFFFSRTILSSVTLTSGFNSFCPKAGYRVCLSRAVTWSDLLFQNIPLELHLITRSVFLLVFLSPPLFAFTRCFEFGYYFNKIENFEFRQRR